MELDVMSLKGFEMGDIPSTIRIFAWQNNCISLGYSQKIEEEIDLRKAQQMGWEVVQRPTGGGIVFHNPAEVSFSVITSIDDPTLPPGLIPSYLKVSEAVVTALKMLGIKAEIQSSPRLVPRHPSPCNGEGTLFMQKEKIPSPRSGEGNKRDEDGEAVEKGVRSLCFSYPAEYEIVCQEKKLVGSAQKRTKKALLQQGSIFIRKNPDTVYSMLQHPYDKENAICVEEILGRKVDFDEISKALKTGFERKLGVKFQ